MAEEKKSSLRRKNPVQEALENSKYPNMVKAFAWSRRLIQLRGETLDSSVLTVEQFTAVPNNEKYNKFIVLGQKTCVTYIDNPMHDHERLHHIVDVLIKSSAAAADDKKTLATKNLVLITPTSLSRKVLQDLQDKTQTDLECRLFIEPWPLERTTFDLRTLEGQPMHKDPVTGELVPDIGLVQHGTTRMETAARLGISSLPKMRLPMDPYARLLGAKVGDVVWIRRPAETEETYRLVVADDMSTGMNKKVQTPKDTTLRLSE